MAHTYIRFDRYQTIVGLLPENLRLGATEVWISPRGQANAYWMVLAVDTGWLAQVREHLKRSSLFETLRTGRVPRLPATADLDRAFNDTQGQYHSRPRWHYQMDLRQEAGQ